MMKNLIYIIGIWALGFISYANSQDVLFSYTVDNHLGPTISKVNVYAQFDGSGNANAAGYTIVFYYNAAEATTATGDVDFSPTTSLGWVTSGNTTYSNASSTNPLVPITFTNRLEIGVLDGNFAGTSFPTTPTLLLKITFTKTPGMPLTGGAVYIGQTMDTDPPIVYFDNAFNGYDVKVTGARIKVLPLKLLSFKAEKSGNKDALISWSTSNEENTSHFIVERSFDKQSWSTVGSLAAAGYSLGVQQYSFKDVGVYNGRDNQLTAYYRLQMVDQDAASKISPIESVVFGTGAAKGQSFVVYPNPSSDGVQVEWDANLIDQPTALEFYNIDGRLVYTQKVSDNTDQQYIDFGHTNIVPGLYMLRIVNGVEPLDFKQIVVAQR